TATNDVDTAVTCMKYGAADYMLKPVERNRMVSGVKRMLQLQALKRENLSLKNSILKEHLQQPNCFEGIVTVNNKIHSLFKYMEAVAASEEPILITGETGVGKELFAGALHGLSERKGQYISVNVSGLDDNVFSDTLFGHKRGAFTDAHQPRKGLVEKAVEGTLFLDEIGDLSMASQVKLLRLLQEKEYYPLGSDKPGHARIRVLFSTNRDIEELIKSGQFRKDLYFRISTHRIRIPPLRERMGDLPLLVEHFVSEASSSMKKEALNVSAGIFDILSNYSFPGNIRELRALIFDAVSTADSGTLSTAPFQKLLKNGKQKLSNELVMNRELDFSAFSQLPPLKLVEKTIINEALKRTGGNISMAARILGLTRQTLSKRLKNGKNK
ncbi:MAG: sigma-54-dependent Fis family transcriptional regulator, partial [bacterium]|nr:sigma-54-dependent Fis family transcriptional regulator [bacterium]